MSSKPEEAASLFSSRGSNGTNNVTKMPPSDQESMTCDALCSLSIATEKSIDKQRSKSSSGKGCPKQHQLPMFLSKTYHMIDRCDPDVATWSSTGDNFVVKNVEKFAKEVLPMYFKHSNFSSFCRQLNFYGFRKLKAEPILTADFDARTASYVRFYHEKFQKDKPELLSSIRRATKSDQQSKDDMDVLRAEVTRLKDTVTTMSTEYERRMNEMSYEYNRRITALSAEHDKLAVLVQQLLTAQATSVAAATAAPSEASLQASAADMMRNLSTVATAMSLQNSLRQAAAAANPSPAAAAAASLGSALAATPAAELLAAVAAGQKRAALPPAPVPPAAAQPSTDDASTSKKMRTT